MHVLLRDGEPATAYGLLTPVTFRRSGPRDDSAKQSLCIYAGIGALTDRVDGVPDWRFHGSVSQASKAAGRLFMSSALRAMEERHVGTVSANMLAECDWKIAIRGEEQ